MTNVNKAPRILVVNRSLDILNLFHDILDEQGYDVELSNFSFESLSTIEKLKPDIIILDFGREGSEEEWQLLKILKLYPPVATIPILLCMSPLFFIQSQIERFQQKNIRLLFNPIDKEELVTVVHEMLSSF
jgi:CheY-like chemotaxis protein